jgi:hypothetical protein
MARVLGLGSFEKVTGEHFGRVDNYVLRHTVEIDPGETCLIDVENW